MTRTTPTTTSPWRSDSSPPALLASARFGVALAAPPSPFLSPDSSFSEGGSFLFRLADQLRLTKIFLLVFCKHHDPDRLYRVSNARFRCLLLESASISVTLLFSGDIFSPFDAVFFLVFFLPLLFLHHELSPSICPPPTTSRSLTLLCFCHEGALQKIPKCLIERLV